jgi:8-oxo-dGTP diphosphatase
MNIKTLSAIQIEVQGIKSIALSVDCVIFGFDDNKLKVLLIRSDLKKFHGKWYLLGDLVDPKEELDDAALRILKKRTGLDDVLLARVKTFGSLNRHPAGRVISVAYCALINIQNHKLKILDYELHWHDVNDIAELAFDHMQILNASYEQLQRRVQEQPLAFSLLPKKFSPRDLQNVCEAILDINMDRRNFRKKFFAMDFLVDIKDMEKKLPHRLVKLYNFNYNKYQKKKKKWVGIDF